MLQISQAFPAIFFQPCQNDPEFNSREGVSFTGAVLRVPSWGRLEKPLWTQGWPLHRMVLLWRRRLASKAGRQSLLN
jgi:hypothetical protein